MFDTSFGINYSCFSSATGSAGETRLFLEKCETFFWTDSTAVLQTLRNTSKHFPVFVANRLSKIEKDQMYYNGVMCQPGLTLEYYRGSARPW